MAKTSCLQNKPSPCTCGRRRCARIERSVGRSAVRSPDAVPDAVGGLPDAPPLGPDTPPSPPPSPCHPAGCTVTSSMIASTCVGSSAIRRRPNRRSGTRPRRICPPHPPRRDPQPLADLLEGRRQRLTTRRILAHHRLPSSAPGKGAARRDGGAPGTRAAQDSLCTAHDSPCEGAEASPASYNPRSPLPHQATCDEAPTGPLRPRVTRPDPTAMSTALTWPIVNILLADRAPGDADTSPQGSPASLAPASSPSRLGTP